MSSFDNAMAMMACNSSYGTTESVIEERIKNLLAKLKNCDSFVLQVGKGIMSYLPQEICEVLYEIYLLNSVVCEGDIEESTIEKVNKVLELIHKGDIDNFLCTNHFSHFCIVLNSITLLRLGGRRALPDTNRAALKLFIGIREWTPDTLYCFGSWLSLKYNSRFLEHCLKRVGSIEFGSLYKEPFIKFLQWVSCNACSVHYDGGRNKEWYDRSPYNAMFNVGDIFAKAYKTDAWTLLEEDMKRYDENKISFLCQIYKPEKFTIGLSYPKFKDLNPHIIREIPVSTKYLEIFISDLSEFGLSAEDLDWEFIPDKKLMEAILGYLRAGWKYQDIKAAIRKCCYTRDAMLSHLNISIFLDDKINWAFVNSMNRSIGQTSYNAQCGITPIKNFKKDFLYLLGLYGDNAEPVIEWLYKIGAGQSQ